MKRWGRIYFKVFLAFVVLLGGLGTAIPAVSVGAEEGGTAAGAAGPDVLLAKNSEWKFYDAGTDLGPQWWGLDKTLWASGAAPLGYKDSDKVVSTAAFGPIQTKVSYGEDKENKPVTTYFSKTVHINQADPYLKFVGQFGVDDGIVLYVNGTEVYRAGMPTGTVTYDTYASSGEPDPVIYSNIDLTSSLKPVLKDGDNEFTAEIHQQSKSSSDIYFDMELAGYKELPGDPSGGTDPGTNPGGPVVDGAPRAVSVVFNGDPKTGFGTAWYTPKEITGTQIQVVEAQKLSGGSEFPAEPDLIFEGSSETVDVYMSKADKSAGKLTTYNSHKALVTGLKPGMEYAYRVGDGQEGHWSEVGRYTTEKLDNQDFTFLFTTDSQGTTENNFVTWGHTLQEGIGKYPNSSFIINSGDLVDNGDIEEQWLWFFEKAKAELQFHPLVPLVGNHESKNYNNYAYHFNLPNISGTGAKPDGSVYAYDYGPAHFMILNTEYSEAKGTDVVYQEQVRWLKNEVAKTDRKWKIVLLHKSPYSVANHYKDSDVLFFRDKLTAVFDELGIDMVLGGHDHTYTRSYQMLAHEAQKDVQTGQDGSVLNPKGTLYLITNAAGDKRYNVKDDQASYAAKFGQPGKEMFTGVNITKDRLSFEVYTTQQGGATELFDNYGITRTDEAPAPVENAKWSRTPEGKVKLSWTAPSKGAAVNGYRIYEKNNALKVNNWTAAVAHTEGTKEYSMVIDETEAGKSYQFVIKAVSGRNNSPETVVTTNEGDGGDPGAGASVSKVTVTFYGDATTSKGFTWFTPLSAPGNDVQVVEKKGGEADFTGAREFTGMNAQSTNSPKELVHKAEATGLKPDTVYFFRVGDKAQGVWSKTGTFRTAPKSGAFTFIDLTDTQAKNEEEAILSSETIAKAFRTVPNAGFMMINGDIVDTGKDEKQWDWLFGHSEGSLLNTTIVPSAGNHEDDANSFIEHFNLNSPDKSDTSTGAYYSYNYGNTHFAILNSNEDSANYSNFSDAQVEWLKKDVREARAAGAKWIIVNFHKGPYTTSNHATDTDIMGPTGVRTKIAPIMAELEIDLVFQGHDHIYARTKPIKKDGTASEASKITEIINGKKIEYTVNPGSPIYLIPATAGPKVYYKNTSPKLGDAYYRLFEVADENHAAKYGPDPSDNKRPKRSQVQNFVGITIDGDKLTAISYEIDQNLNNKEPFIIDQFGIVKKSSPGGNPGGGNNGGGNGGNGGNNNGGNTGGTGNGNPNSGGSIGQGSTGTGSDGKGTGTGSTPNGTTAPGAGNGNANGGTGNTGNNPGKGQQVSQLNDIKGHWAESAINQALAKALVTGYGNGKFQPDKAVNRLEFMVMLDRVLGNEAAGSGPKLNFKDADKIPAWGREAAQRLVQSGLISGYSDNTVRPTQELTRAEMAVLIAKAAKLETNPKAKLAFADAAVVPAWAVPYVAAAVDAGLLSGVGGNRFAPGAKATRAEAAAMLLKLY
ncbi:S-layer homology domain-containing protein [Paenibacillus tuaregi]|uniref:S-layer homology domain-containing protein n=1 Tax=Paenibacillus tuaregi TaxID=1816681 RepID=UPI0008398AF9|nr:S-layer homology domain-containing protein [Paenibacillus tuaregi]